MGKGIKLDAKKVKRTGILASAATAAGLITYAAVTGDLVTPFVAAGTGLGVAAAAGVVDEIKDARGRKPSKAAAKAPAKAPAKAAAKGKSGKSFVSELEAEQSISKEAQLVR